MIILGIDPAKSSGHALIDSIHGADPLRLASGVLRFSARESFYRQIVRVLRGLPAVPEKAFIESPVLYFIKNKKGQDEPRNLIGYRTHAGILALWIDAVYEVFKVRREIIYPSEWQSPLFRGVNGFTTKDKSRAFCAQKWGYRTDEPDEADALCIAFFGHTRYGFIPRFDPTDKHAGTKRALAENIRRHGGDPLLLQLLEEKEKRK
jgi:hypothetical protein